ncbi:MAG TPA: hypothetical protein PKC80_12115 [Burkholderiaceae bacterium]|nr:hypothetical protein [Burkholderiaceae bacterium]
MPNGKIQKTTSPNARPVSPNNPCPFLRGLVAQGALADDVEPLRQVAKVITATALKGEGAPKVPAAAIYGVALIANGLSPLSVLKTQSIGLRLNQLRASPLNKHGVGSGILDAKGKISQTNLKRLRSFASEKTDKDGKIELGFSLAELTIFMDANFERAAGKRRLVDRKMMDAEWPVLLKVIGKEGNQGRYLSLVDVETLFVERQLPKRMQD